MANLLRYGLAILLSAFLLFFIQPLVAKKLLPELGGTATIWTTCMMFFQVALFLGYVYAHAVVTLVRPVTGWMIHNALLILTIGWLCLQPFNNAESGSGELAWTVTHRLILTIGLPFLVLSATSPLIQAWCSVSHPQQQAYRLYALSNAGSLLALITYPFIFDPWIGLSDQGRIWDVSFVIFALLMLVSGTQIASATWSTRTFNRVLDNDSNSDPGPTQELRITRLIIWVALAKCGSVLLIAASNILCQEVASFPFLWLLPLICYLLTLIICFDWPGLYQRWFFQPVFAAACFLAIIVYHFGVNIGLVGQAVGCCAVLFAGCMICHGELVRLRPDSTYLTWFYLAVSFGGAAGGVFAVVLAPRIFSRFFEFHAALIGVTLLSTSLFLIEQYGRIRARRIYGFLMISGLAIVPVLSSLYFFFDPALNPGIVFQGRNDYGLISVKQTEKYRIMRSGSTNHGGQFLAKHLVHEPFAYYSAGSGAERAFSLVRSHRNRPDTSLRIGVIGLGTGSLLNHGRRKDKFRFYEINPMVEQVALKYFSYLPADNANIVLGDGRVLLGEEFEQSGSQRFDLLFLDAFSSDSIPAHLLTSECFDLYLKHLDPQGIIVAHITNKFVDLKPVLAAVATSKQLNSVYIRHNNDDFEMVTDWVLLSPDSDLLNSEGSDSQERNWMNGLDELNWTDDNSSVFPIVRWSHR